MNLYPLRRIGLLDRVIPPDDDYPDTYLVNGVLPMLWFWLRSSIDYVTDDWQTTWRVIRQDHPLINQLLPGDVWEKR